MAAQEHNQPPTIGQVQNGFTSIIGRIQLLQRRVMLGLLDNEKVYHSLAYIESLVWKAAQTTSHLQEQHPQFAESLAFVAGDAAAVSEVGYGLTAPVLSIQFRQGPIYHYYDVPPEVYQGLMSAESKGQFFISQIRGRYPFRRAR